MDVLSPIYRTAQPFIAPRLISGSGFGTVNLFNGLYGGVTAAVVALIPLSHGTVTASTRSIPVHCLSPKARQRSCCR